MVEQIRYRTREGMKTAVRKGKASTCLAYRYKLSQQRDEMGDPIRGQRDIDPDKAVIVRRIFRLYADGMSPRDIAQLLNNESVIGTHGKNGVTRPSADMSAVAPASSTMRAMSAAWSGTNETTARTRRRRNGPRGPTMPPRRPAISGHPCRSTD
ncbi:recombinase family protein [Rhizobium sp. DKSPLA3]|uniref:Recombinase family protein n=1 Tax=Rhizobium quercicola TaxID=2901226 RepID=A0A9X1NY97_9HYPH|nr:recombinase family protein [Rhizobium quercicola]MCD7111919.1 recombinase family protein [Rhizobium quercicola]